MIEHRPFADLGGADHGWLKTRHHFSFADYFDPERMSWGDLRVWNDDEIAPGTGFPLHPHANMEIITYVRDGAISHQDSVGHQGRTAAGDVQVMSAGTGLRHAEFNLEDGVTRIFQISDPAHRDRRRAHLGHPALSRADRAGRFVVLASGLGDDGDALPIRARARVLGATLGEGGSATLEVDPARHLYLVPAVGEVEVNGVQVPARDGVAITGEAAVSVRALGDGAEVVLVDAP